MNPIKSRKHASAFRPLPLATASLAAGLGLAALPSLAFAETDDGARTLDKVDVHATRGYKADKVASPKFTQSLQDTPQTIQVITADLFNQQGATTLTEALRNSPGVGTFYAGENGNTTTGTILVDIIDDVPTARADADSVTEGASATGNVLTGVGTTGGAAGADTAGADGFGTPTVVGVAAGSNTAMPVSGGVGGAGIAGAYGTLTLNADGSYTYAANPDAVTSDQTDTFVYTIVDGDGDQSTTTLTISVNNVTLTASDTDALVNEAVLFLDDSMLDQGDHSPTYDASCLPSDYDGQTGDGVNSMIGH